MDSLVQGTNDSSTLSKLSMVRHEYFQDDFIHHFAAKEVRRSPLIHLGYFVRALVMDRHVRIFLQSFADSDPQVLSLGAGFDTTFFRVWPSFPTISYFEVDLPDVVRNKISIIRNSQELRSSIVPEKLGAGTDTLSSKHYSIFAHDLSSTEGLADKLQHHGFDFSRPTLIFSECSITYIEENRSDNLIQWAAKNLPNGTFMNYEQFNPDDGFGQVMISHFKKIQSPLQSVSTYRTLRDQRERYLNAGWTRCNVVCVMDLVRHLLSASELSEIFKKEPFDEWEEFHLKCCHYSLAVASHGTSLLTRWNHPKDLKGEVRTEAFVDVTPLEQFQLERFAHTVCRLRDGAALVIGGFGAIPGNPHSRCSHVQYVGNFPKKVRIVPHPPPGSFDCLHFTCTPLGRDKFVLYGGRTSPAREMNSDPLFLSVSNQTTDNDVEVRMQKIKLESDNKPQPRWRHGATSLHGNILVFGGRNKNLEVFGDLWELSVTGGNTWRWREIRCGPNQAWPKPRFSHALASNGNSAYLSGGLDADFRPLNDVWELTKYDGELVWKELEPNGAFPSVYSHNLHICGDKLILLGGVNESHSEQPQLTVIDLPTLSTRRYTLRVVDKAHTFLLHNFSSISAEDGSVICYGGGGNCFSFGTHFNKCALKLTHLMDL